VEKEKKIFLALGSIAGVVALGALVGATQYAAAELAYHRALGSPLARIGSVSLYAPWACMDWYKRFHARAPKVFDVVQAMAFGGGLVSFLLFMIGISRLRGRPASTAHGSARWAAPADLRKVGLLDQAGVVLCQTNDARYTSQPDGKGGVKWAMKRPGELIRHSGPEHILVFAPTRSGKGIGTVVPTLLSWEASVVVYDIKRELWTLTAGWRRKFTHCWRFEPMAADSVKFNPLFEIRRGENEVRDAQTVAETLIDPDGAKEKSHWTISGAALLTGAILHVLYAEEDKSLRGLAAFLSDPDRTEQQTFERMLLTQHLPTGPHPVVAQTARSMLSKSDNEMSGVMSTAKAALTLYADPIVAANTATSDFRITDLMNADSPVSLYLVVPPSDDARLRPLIRLMLQQFGRRLTESLGAHKHRLLMLLDEFPSLGRLSFFESALAYSAGYGIKCMLICQSLSQLEKAYGQDNSILDNSHVRMTYTANCDKTAKRISEQVGTSTMSKRTRNVSGKGLLGARSVSEGEQEFARPLLTPDEVMRLPFDDAILTVGGVPAYRARKIMYYLDDRFGPRVKAGERKRPDSPRQQRAELLAQRGPSEWQTLPSPSRSPSATPAPAPSPEESTTQAPTSAPAVSPATANSDDVDTAGWATYFGTPASDEAAATNDDAEPGEDPRPRRPGSLPL
jgi:type IV secretion system protein VirD4